MIGQEWFDNLLPEGFPLKTSTLVSGPGGSGKPLIGNAIVAAWLRAAGSVVFMSLQYPTRDFLLSSLKTVGSMDLNDYAENTAFIELDPAHASMDAPTDRGFKANLVKPDIWESAIEQACGMVPDHGPGILVFGSALNLLMFSPTYSEQTVSKMYATMAEDKRRTYLFSASTKPKTEQVQQLERAADNLIMSYKEQDAFVLHMTIKRMKGVAFSNEEITVPIAAEALEDVKQVAHHSRQRVIPQISQI